MSFTNETKRFYNLYNSTSWKAIHEEDAFGLQIQCWETCMVLLLKKKILPIFLINKIQPTPQGNFAKGTIYLNAFFWNSTVHTWAPVWILHILGSRQIGTTSLFVKFVGSEQCTWCIQLAQFCWVVLDRLRARSVQQLLRFSFQFYLDQDAQMEDGLRSCIFALFLYQVFNMRLLTLEKTRSLYRGWQDYFSQGEDLQTST